MVRWTCAIWAVTTSALVLAFPTVVAADNHHLSADRNHLLLLGTYQGTGLLIIDPDGNDALILDQYANGIATSEQPVTGLKYAFGRFAGGFTFRPSDLVTDVSGVDTFTSWNNGKIGIDVWYQAYRGFGITVPEHEYVEKLYPEAPNEYPDLRVTNTGIGLYWYLRRNEVYRAFNQTISEPRELDFSPYFRIAPGILRFRGSTPLALSPGDASEDWITRGMFVQLPATVGLTALIPVWNLFAAGSVDIGFEPTIGVYGDGSDLNEASRDVTAGFTPTANLAAAIGFAGRRVYFGLWFTNINQVAFLRTDFTSADETVLEERRFRVQAMNYRARLYAGLRL